MNNKSSLCESFEDSYEIIANSWSGVFIGLVVVNTILSIVAILGNCLIVDALRKCRSLHSPSKSLLSSLALADLGVGCIAQPLFIIHRLAALTQSHGSFCVAGVVSNFAGSIMVAASFFTMTAVALDRYLALRLRIRYREVVTLKRVIAVLSTSWIASIVWSSLWFWSKKALNISRVVIFSICLVITTATYSDIYRRMRHFQFRVSVTQSNARSFNVLRYRRSVISMCYLYCFLLVCYLPYACLLVVQTKLHTTPLSLVLSSAFVTLILSNSALNPVLYCRCIPGIRDIVRASLSHMQQRSFRLNRSWGQDD